VFWAGRVKSLRTTDWFVYAEPPFSGPEKALAKLARYMHRVAITTRSSLRSTTPSRPSACGLFIATHYDQRDRFLAK